MPPLYQASLLVGVGVGNGVSVGWGVGVLVGVFVGKGVLVGVGEGNGVSVGNGVGVIVGVSVGRGVFVGNGVLVGDAVGNGVSVGRGVSVAVGDGSDVDVSVGGIVAVGDMSACATACPAGARAVSLGVLGADAIAMERSANIPTQTEAITLPVRFHFHKYQGASRGQNNSQRIDHKIKFPSLANNGSLLFVGLVENLGLTRLSCQPYLIIRSGLPQRHLEPGAPRGRVRCCSKCLT